MTVAHAANITYTVDPIQSELTLSGTFGTQPLLSQTEMGFITSYSGTITAQRDVTNNTLQIIGGSVAAANGGSYAPPYYFSSPPSVSGLPGNYGFDLPAEGFPVAEEFLFSIRNFSFSISSAVVSTPASFDSSALSATIGSGDLDFGEIFTSHFNQSPTESDGSASLAGSLTFASSPGSLSNAGQMETLNIPIETDFTVDFGDGGALSLQLSGTLVATGTLPQPVSVPFLALAMTFLLGRRQLRKADRGHTQLYRVSAVRNRQSVHLSLFTSP